MNEEIDPAGASIIPEIATDSRPGPNLSIALKFKVIDNLDLEPEFQYLQKGGTSEIESNPVFGSTGNNGIIRFDEQFDYLQLNLNFRPYLDIGKNEIYALGGLYVSYLLSNSGNSSLLEYKDWSYGYAIGIGYTYKFEKNPLLLEIIYSTDLNYIYNSDSRKIKLAGLQLRLGIEII